MDRHKQVYSDGGRPLNKTRPHEPKWVDFSWNRIIRRTDLFKWKTDNNGEQIQSWFHFHDLRRTAIHRYADVETYNMGTSDYSYLLGHSEESRMTKKYLPKHYYNICRRIKTIIDNGDELIARQALDNRDVDDAIRPYLCLAFMEAKELDKQSSDYEPSLSDVWNNSPDEVKRQFIELLRENGNIEDKAELPPNVVQFDKSKRRSDA